MRSKYWPCTTRRWASASLGWGNPIWRSLPIETFVSAPTNQKCEVGLRLDDKSKNQVNFQFFRLLIKKGGWRWIERVNWRVMTNASILFKVVRPSYTHTHTWGLRGGGGYRLASWWAWHWSRKWRKMVKSAFRSQIYRRAREREKEEEGEHTQIKIVACQVLMQHTRHSGQVAFLLIDTVICFSRNGRSVLWPSSSTSSSSSSPPPLSLPPQTGRV